MRAENKTSLGSDVRSEERPECRSKTIGGEGYMGETVASAKISFRSPQNRCAEPTHPYREAEECETDVSSLYQLRFNAEYDTAV